MRSKAKTNRTLYAQFFSRLEQIRGNCKEFWLVIALFAPVAIGQSNYFSPGSWTYIWKPLQAIIININNYRSLPRDFSSLCEDESYIRIASSNQRLNQTQLRILEKQKRQFDGQAQNQWKKI